MHKINPRHQVRQQIIRRAMNIHNLGHRDSELIYSCVRAAL